MLLQYFGFNIYIPKESEKLTCPELPLIDAKDTGLFSFDTTLPLIISCPIKFSEIRENIIVI